MSSLKPVVEQVKAGKTVEFCPTGNSMSGRIESGQLVSVVPIDPLLVEKGDVVLCRVAGSYYLHLVKAVQKRKKKLRFLIGNNHGGTNGWTSQDNIFGKYVPVS